MSVVIVLSILAAIWCLPYALRFADAEELPGRHRGGEGRGPRDHTSRHNRGKPATLVVQWLTQERQGVRMTFEDFCHLQAWKEQEEWNTVRMAAGGW